MYIYKSTKQTQHTNEDNATYDVLWLGYHDSLMTNTEKYRMGLLLTHSASFVQVSKKI